MGKVSDIRSNTRPNIICLENHPNDSRVKIRQDGICQSLTGRMGTGGGNVPLVLFVKSRRAKSKDDYETWVKGDVANTLNTFDGGNVRATNIVVYEDNINRQMESGILRGKDVDTSYHRRNGRKRCDTRNNDNL